VEPIQRTHRGQDATTANAGAHHQTVKSLWQLWNERR